MMSLHTSRQCNAQLNSLSIWKSYAAEEGNDEHGQLKS